METLRRLVDEGRVTGGGGGGRAGKGGWGGRIASIAIEGLGDGHFKVIIPLGFHNLQNPWNLGMGFRHARTSDKP